MHIRGTKEVWPRAKWIEGVFLVAAAPFLLFPAQSIILTTAALVTVVLLWLWPLLFLRTPLIPSSPFNLVLLIFMVMVAVAVLVTADPHLTLPKASGIILGFSAWRFIVVYINRRALYAWAVGGFIVLGIAMTLFGFLNADWLLKSTSQVPLLQGLERISTAPIPLFNEQNGIHPNQVAGTILLYLPLLLSLALGSQFIRQRKLFLGAVSGLVIFSLITLILTQSRSGWLGITAGLFCLLLLWAWLLPPSPWRRIVWTLFLASMLLALLLGFQLGATRLIALWLEPPQETVIGSLATLNFRQEIWPWAVAAIRDFPFTGTGLGAFRLVARRLYPVQVVDTFDIAHAHNVFLQMTLDLGIPGLITYLALLILAFKVGWRIARRDAGIRAVAAGIMAGLAAFHVYGLTDTVAVGSKPSLLFWILLALLGAANEICSQQNEEQTAKAAGLIS